MSPVNRALCLPGGAQDGAWQAGAALGCAEIYPEESPFNRFYGVSVGILNGMKLAQGRDFKRQCEKLCYLWSEITTPDVYKAGSFLTILWEMGIHDTKPLFDMMKREWDVDAFRQTGFTLKAGAVNLETREYGLFDARDPEFLKGALASAAFPALFPPVEINGYLYADGGIQNVSPIKAAIDDGADEIVVLLPAAKNLTPAPKPVNTLGVLTNALDCMMREVTENDIKMARMYNRLIAAGEDCEEKRLIDIKVYRAKKPLPTQLMCFDPKISLEIMDMGYDVVVNGQYQ